ncbi:cation transporting atpase [Nannochloropsis oceanica]
MITGDNPATAAAVGRMAGAFMGPDHGPCLLLDGEGTERDPLHVSDMAKPEATTTLEAYLRSFFPYDNLHLPSSTASFSHPTPPSSPQKKTKEERNSGPSSLPPSLPTSLAIYGPHDLVVTGRAFQALHRAHEERLDQEEGWSALELVIAKGNIFARMSPQHKQDLVRSLQDTGLVVCMTGDGANDSGALKAGDIGISIAAKASSLASSDDASPPASSSVTKKRKGMMGRMRIKMEGGDEDEDEDEDEGEDQDDRKKAATEKKRMNEKAEAAVMAAPSIAAPFATGIHHIGAVAIILAEGRCALTTSITMFKYMFVYGIIQFTSVLILYALLLELTSQQYLWADMGVVLGFVVLVPTMGPKPYLQRGRPETNLVSPTILRSVIGQTVIVVSFSILQQYILSLESWYTRGVMDKSNLSADSVPATDEATAKFLLSNFQYIFTCLAFCQTYGLFRVPIYRTPALAVYVAVQFALGAIFCLLYVPWLAEAFNMTKMPSEYRIRLFLFCICNGAVSLLYERICVPHVSDDEEPVAPGWVGPITCVPKKVALQENGERGPRSRVWSVTLDDLEAEERERMLCPCLDFQPTILPKIRKGPPMYHRLREGWTQAEEARQREKTLLRAL